MNKRIQIIDGLRGIAILGVVWHHLFATSTPPGFISFGPQNFPFLPFHFLANGWLGVNLFFALSGFVLFYPYVSELRKFETKQDWLLYYKNRALRLLPLYYIAVLYGFIFIAPPDSKEKLLHDSFFMLTATYQFTKELWFPPYNWVLWSLAIEIWFSLIFPFIVLLTQKISVTKTFILVAIIALIVRFIGLQEAFQLKGSIYLSPLRDSLIGRLDDFLLGMLIVWIWLKSPAGKATFWSKNSTFVMGLFLIYLASHLWNYYALNILPMNFVPFLNLILLAGLFLVILYLLNTENKLSQIFQWKIFTKPGLMCYSIYIWHGVLMIQIIGANRTAGNTFLYFLALAFVSFMSFHFIEMNKKFRPSAPTHSKKAKK